MVLGPAGGPVGVKGEMTLPGLVVLGLTVALTLFWLADGATRTPAVFPMPTGKAYVAECGACHTAYAPGLLPVRAWVKMMAELENHFGEDASLDEAARTALLTQIADLAADSAGAGMLMRRIAAGIPADEAPQRFSAAPFFVSLHDEVPESAWKRTKVGGPANCIACHARANEGSFDETAVRIPE